MFRTTLLATALACLAPLADAHDFWVRPNAYILDAPGQLDIQLRVGDDFAGAPYARNPAHAQRFVIAGPNGVRDVPGVNGRDPAGAIELESIGTYVIGYRSHRSPVSLDGAKFQSYLVAEGLDRIARLRVEAGTENSPGHEVFSRCAKALVQVGETSDVAVDHALGMRLELVAATNPMALDADRNFSATLLFEGRPLAGALVSAHHHGSAPVELSARTDAEGRVTLPLRGDGEWLIAAVHMVSAPDTVDADWESLWASLTFATTKLDELHGHAHEDDRMHAHPHTHDG